MRARRRWLTILLLLGAVATLGLLLQDPPESESPDGARREAPGSATVPRLEGAAAANGGMNPRRDRPGAPPDAAENLAQPDDAPADLRPSLLVETVDGLTGRTVAAEWNLGTGEIGGAPFPPGAVIDEAAMARSRAGVRASLAAWEGGFLPAGATRKEALGPEVRVNAPYVVRPAAGYVLEDPAPRIVGHLAAGVERTKVILPVWPEAVLDLRVLDPEGQPANDVQLEGFVAAGRRRPARLEAQGDGVYRVRGIPRLPDEPVRGVLLWGFDEEAEEEEVLEEEVGSLLDLVKPQVVTQIPARSTDPWQLEIRLKRSRGPCWDSVETDNDLAFEEDLGDGEGLPSPSRSASIRVQVLGFDGRPVRDALIDGESVDAEGRLLLSNLVAGTRTILMTASGRFGARHTLDLVEGSRTEVTIREPVGARVDVLVTDAEGHPRSAARLIVRGRRVFDVVDGVQRLDLYTNALGRRSLERVEPGLTTIKAIWGSRAGSQTVELRDGVTTTVHIVAK